MLNHEQGDAEGAHPGRRGQCLALGSGQLPETAPSSLCRVTMAASSAAACVLPTWPEVTALEMSTWPKIPPLSG